MAALAALPFLGPICNEIGNAYDRYVNGRNWRETHQTLAPAVGRSIENVSNAFGQATLNAQRDASSACSKVLKGVIQLTVVGALSYAVNSFYPSSCKTNPNAGICTIADGIQITAHGCLAIAAVYSMYSVSKSMNAKENPREISPAEQRQMKSRREIREAEEKNSMLTESKKLAAESKALQAMRKKR